MKDQKERLEQAHTLAGKLFDFSRLGVWLIENSGPDAGLHTVMQAIEDASASLCALIEDAEIIQKEHDEKTVNGSEKKAGRK